MQRPHDGDILEVTCRSIEKTFREAVDEARQQAREEQRPAMTATLTFDLDDSHGRYQHRRALAGEWLAAAIGEFDQELRGMVKHGHECVMERYDEDTDSWHRESVKWNGDMIDAAEHLRSRLWEILDEEGVKFVLTGGEE